MKEVLNTLGYIEERVKETISSTEQKKQKVRDQYLQEHELFKKQIDEKFEKEFLITKDSIELQMKEKLNQLRNDYREELKQKETSLNQKKDVLIKDIVSYIIHPF